MGLAFAWGLLAEKLGYAINWAAFVEKQCASGRNRFETFDELHQRRGAGNEDEHVSMAVDTDEEDLLKAEDDWQLNRHPKRMDTDLVRGYDLRLALGYTSERTVSPPCTPPEEERQ
ncbi:hypothetical protein M758_UG201000 [Ceratodon purpureus]|nr:hypothetical protein M758_UG201000 [Ceratodon purpureus]